MMRMSIKNNKHNTSLLHCPSIIWGISLHQINFPSRNTTNGLIPTTLNPTIHISCIEALKPNVKRNVSLKIKQGHLFNLLQLILLLLI